MLPDRVPPAQIPLDEALVCDGDAGFTLLRLAPAHVAFGEVTAEEQRNPHRPEVSGHDRVVVGDD
ncbi:MAG TPA: hypothetical protein VHH91_12350, partial [Vicinamibacterales bacterium]|nr:hypothetical protein [Vicinamibacterales bacterium]